MKKALIISVTLMISIFGFSQEFKTIYLNKKRQETKENRAKYICKVNRINDTLIKISEYDDEMNLLMTGEYKSINPMVKNGQFIYFDYGIYDKVSGYYSNDTMVNKWFYHDDNFSDKVKDYSNLTNITRIPRDDYMDSIGAHVIGEIMPSFEGGTIKEFQRYIAKNLIYPPNPSRLEVSGTAIVDFVVDVNGDVILVGIAQSSLDKDLDREALRVISQSPKWIPGIRSGETIPISISLPIKFIYD